MRALTTMLNYDEQVKIHNNELLKEIDKLNKAAFDDIVNR